MRQAEKIYPVLRAGSEVLPLIPGGVTGSTVGAPSLFSGTCDSYGTGESPERVHAFKVTTPLKTL